MLLSKQSFDKVKKKMVYGIVVLIINSKENVKSNLELQKTRPPQKTNKQTFQGLARVAPVEIPLYSERACRYCHLVVVKLVIPPHV